MRSNDSKAQTGICRSLSTCTSKLNQILPPTVTLKQSKRCLRNIKVSPPQINYLSLFVHLTYSPFVDPDKEGIITVEGTMQFCQAIGIEPTQLEFLLLSYHFGSERMGEFARDAFVHGCLRLQCDSIQKLADTIPNLRQQLDDLDQFREIYNFAFLLGRQTGQKSLCNQFCEGISLQWVFESLTCV